MTKQEMDRANGEIDCIVAKMHEQQLQSARRRKKEAYNRLFHALECCRQQLAVTEQARKVMSASLKEEQEVLDRYLTLLSQLEDVQHEQSLEESSEALTIIRFIADEHLSERYQQWCKENDVPF